ncbi:MAG: glycosyltransferase family 2 protein [Bacteroidetes bacterium]|nr:glycosyltransferase family 2 protein [Bacteroidota bacterium]
MISETSTISLVICTYNRCEYLPSTLQSISNQTLAAKYFQVIIIDNASTDNTKAISEEFISKHPQFNISYFFESNKGLSYARNRGIAEAACPIIAYIDDDVILSPSYLEELCNFFSNNQSAQGAGGKVIPKYESGGEPTWMNKYLYGFIGKVDYGNQLLKFIKPMKYPAGCNMIYKKELLTQIGGFNNNLKFRSDDKYIFLKANEATREIYYLPDAWLYHYIDERRLQPENFKKLFLKTGNEEKKRLQSENDSWGIFKKFIEYLIKWAVSLILFLIFLIKGHPQQGRYIVISQWCTLRGFLMKEVFVR